MTPAEFRTIFPAFEGRTDTQIQKAIDLATPHFDVARWDDLLTEGLSNFVAHHLALAPHNADRVEPNDVVSTTRETLSTTRSEAHVNAQRKNPYNRTEYGQRYLHLARLVGMGPIASGGDLVPTVVIVL